MKTKVLWISRPYGSACMLRRKRTGCPGSITVFMSLILCLMFSLVSAGIASVRYAAARTQVINSVDVGLYSLFAGYDRALLDRYDLFAIDASAPDGSLDLGMIYDEFNRYMNPVLLQNHQHLLPVQSGLSGYALLTDDNGAIFFRQAVQYMRQTAFAQAAEAIQTRYDMIRNSSQEAEEAGRRMQEADTMNQYDREMEDAARRSQEEEERIAREASANIGGDAFSDGTIPGERETDSAPPPDIVNPIPVIRRIQAMGLLALVFPTTKALSGERIATGHLPSRRVLDTGVGMEGWYPRENGWMADLLFTQYVVSKLGHFMRPSDLGLQYQLEYVIGRKDSDQDNLEVVARRLLLIRQGVNAACLSADSEKMAQAIQLASLISATFRCTPAPVVILAAIVTCWSFAESILDVRTLLAGGKVPMVKSPFQWQISLENLPNLLDRLDSDRIEDDHGLSYTDYLQVMVMALSRQQKTFGAMDMMESTLQKLYQQDEFRLDRCIAAAGGGVDVIANGRWFLTCERALGYD